jgi:hypothetical protein
MVEWMREKPEVVACLRYLHSADALPDWVGRFKEEVDYAEMLRREGIELPAMVGDAEETVSDGEAVTETDDGEDDIQGGAPVQANATVANNFEPREPMGTHGQSQAPTHGHPRQPWVEEPREAMEGATAEGCITA